ncbi:AMP-binding protein [uncultured Aeromicrobium sp.]|uniref:AMP-binding protein n=1 Tax=uncultured Aeromicrobium sp. TaxID=337820 RepID=UPI0025DFEB5B|nr:AMP-binding protein [uncultured Aeromicrobium sp.]
MNLTDYLRHAARDEPDGIALVEPRTDRELTWAELDQWVDRAAQTLLGQGLVAGHRVALAMTNGIDLAVAYLAVLRVGMVAVPLNPRGTARELSRAVADCQPKLIVADADSIAQVRASDTASAVVVVHRVAPDDGELRFAELLEHASSQPPVAPADAETLAVILYTSGATGSPRGAQLTHRALIANVEQVARVEPAVLGARDVVLGLLPLFHVYGLNAILGQALRARATLLLVESFDPDAALTLIAARGVTVVPVAPPVIAAWAGREGARQALARVRMVLSGAAPLDPDLAEDFARATGHRVHQGYGLTEAGPVVAATFVRPETPNDPYSVGWPLPGVELELRDALGAPAAPGDPAQIWIRGDNLFSGYWPDGADGPDADGWYATGDLGILDEYGALALVDRVRELVLVSGFSVYPSEVEDVVGRVPGVEHVAVVGAPDERTGEAVVAFVVPADDAPEEGELIERIDAACRESLARFKVPSRIVVVAGLPHSPTGKVAKGRLRALARSAELGLDSEHTSRSGS